MHNLAIALHLKGYKITGSDDQIFDPSKSRLEKYGLLPAEWGWDEARITRDLDAVIIGMHARQDNPELKKSIELGLKIYSFPEFLFEQTKNKKRVVIAGSHGKTTITSMILYVLQKQNVKFDYMVGSQIPGFETMVGFSKDSEIAIFEGDEYLSSPLDPRPKFAHYKPHITLISGIAWDHMNVYPDYKEYVRQFLELCKDTDPKGHIIYYRGDEEILKFIGDEKIKSELSAYIAPDYSFSKKETQIRHAGKIYPSKLIGKYNMENLVGAMKVCEKLGISNNDFLLSMADFKGAARRQELIFESEKLLIYRDFAHAPSKVKATVQGFKEFHPDKKLTAFLEIHTFSSLNKDFLPQYRSSMDLADIACVYYDPEVVSHKKLPPLDPEFVRSCFGEKNIIIITSKTLLQETIARAQSQTGILLLMSSGNFGGINILT